MISGGRIGDEETRSDGSPPGNIAQSYVAAMHHAGLEAGGLQTIELAHACQNLDTPVIHLFTDGFESGDTSAWSNAVP